MFLQANFSGWFIVIGSASFLLLLIFFFLLFFQYSRRRINHANEVLQLKTAFDQTLMQSKLEIQEQTFQHISYEIHDNIGQVLSLVRLNINSLAPDKIAEKINETDALLEKAIDDLRHLSHSLNANRLKENGFVASVINLLESVAKTGRYQISISNQAEDAEVAEEHTIILYRVIQELLTNVIKHAKASQISLLLEGHTNLRKIVLTDNGVGFDPSIRSHGMGLSTIAARAKAIGADVRFESSVSEGTQVSIFLPPH